MTKHKEVQDVEFEDRKWFSILSNTRLLQQVITVWLIYMQYYSFKQQVGIRVQP